MSLALYMDHHVPRVITQRLRARGVDVLTAYEDGADRLADAELVDRATRLGRVLFTQDYDFLAETKRRQQAEESFQGVIYAHPMHVNIGTCVHDLELIAKTCEPEDIINQVEGLPLR